MLDHPTADWLEHGSSKPFHTMAGFSPAVLEAIGLVLSSDAPLNIQKQEVYKILDADKLSYFEDIHVGDILIHPDNRGGLVVNKHDTHTKGLGIVLAGADFKCHR